jgi:Tol biopolymer transport system component/uncharacterized protein YxeA
MEINHFNKKGMKPLIQKIKVTLIFLLLIQINNGFSQSYSKEFKKGEEAFIEAEYAKAAKHYENSTKLVKKFKKKHQELFFKLGYCQMQTKNYKDASNTFSKYLTLARQTKINEHELKMVSEWKTWCENTIYASNEEDDKVYTNNIRLENISDMNTLLSEVGAIQTFDNEFLIFSSNKYYPDKKNDLQDINHDIFVAKLIDGEISVIRKDEDINSSNDDISSTITGDNKTMFISIADQDGKSDIYEVSFNKGRFGKPSKLPKSVNSKYWDGYPSVTRDGKILYFVSDRPDGIGGMDIYLSTKDEEGNWSEAVNMGRMINTTGNEVTPCIDPSGKILYFSSDGHFGEGGYDVFMSEFEASNAWSQAKNMEIPINSKSDEIFYTLTSNPDIALMSTNRTGSSGMYDVYKVLSGEEEVEEEIIAEVDETGIDEIKKELEIDNTPKGKVVELENPEDIFNLNDDDIIASLGITKGQLFNTSVVGLEFRVQIGAYRNHITKNHKVFTSKLDPNDITEEMSPENLYKYTIGVFNTIGKATDFKLNIRGKSYKDSFLACYFNNKRITMDEAKQIIVDQTKVN